LWTATLRLDDGGQRDWGWSIPGGASLGIDADGQIVAITGKVEGGQGNRNSLTRMVAAELGVPTTAVRLEMGDTGIAAVDFGTVGSRSTPDTGRALRLLARALRAALVEEAAGRFGVEPAALHVEAGTVSHRATQQRTPYGLLVAGPPRTLEVDPDGVLPPEPPGLSTLDDDALRASLTAAVTGAKRFPSDVTDPGVWHGVWLRPPAHGATLSFVDTSAAEALPVTVVVAGDTVGVAAPTRTAARAALDLVRVEWQTPPQPAAAGLVPHLRRHAGEPTAGREAGDVEAALAGADVCVEATYTTAFIAHVPMEPRAALADWDGAQLTVHVGTQRPFAVRTAVAEALGLAEPQVRVVVPDFGGGFGGKHKPDIAIEAARLAYAAGHPVLVRWTRAEEFTWAYLRPAAVVDVRAGAARDGSLVGWDFTNIHAGAAGLAAPYAVPNLRERFCPVESPLPVGSYRALAATANNFARESHVDDLAAGLGVDPVQWRLGLLTDDRLADVLRRLADRIGWPDRDRRPGYGLGLACGIEKSGRVATAAEVTVDPDGTLHLRRIVTCFDCGAIVDPTGLRNQVVGATVMGLGGALFERIEFDHGQIRSTSLSTYRVPRFTDVPPIEVILVDRPEYPSAGGGETPIIAVAPAIGNAIFAATGRRLRDLPLLGNGAGGGYVAYPPPG
jgi:isoquinoline 1-oxidoreductase